ncbi:MAG: arabinose transporter [Hyphomicrobiales bacterium]
MRDAENSPGKPSAPSTTRVLLPVMAVVLVVFFVIGLALPALPLHVNEGLGLGFFAIGLIAGSQFGASVLSRFSAGNYADRHGPKPGVVIGLWTASASGVLYLASLAAVGAPVLSAAILLAGRAVMGIAESFVITSAVSWGFARVDTAKTRKVIAWVGMSMFGALAIGAPVGAAIYAMAGFACIGLVTTLAPLAVLIAIVRLPAVKPIRTSAHQGFGAILRSVWMPGVGAALSSFGFGAILAFGAILFAERGWGDPWLPFTAYAAGLIIARILLGHLPDRLGGARVALVSVFVEAAGLIGLWVAGDPLVAAAGAMLTGAGYALVYPGLGLEAVRRTLPENRGAAMGIFTIFLDVALGLGTPVLGVIANHGGLSSVFLASAVIVMASSLVSTALLRRSAMD